MGKNKYSWWIAEMGSREKIALLPLGEEEGKKAYS